MFICPRGDFVPKSLNNIKQEKQISHLENKQMNILDLAMVFLKKVLLNDNLTASTAFDCHSLYLLNLVNILLPMPINKIIRTSVKYKQSLYNTNEYLRTLRECGYKPKKAFQERHF